MSVVEEIAMMQIEEAPMSDQGRGDEVPSDENVDQVDEAACEEKKYKGETWGAEDWMAQCSLHLSHIEKRLMEAEFLGHEVVRQLGNLLVAFNHPPKKRRLWWPMRKATDIAVRTLRQFVRYYMREYEGNEQ